MFVTRKVKWGAEAFTLKEYEEQWGTTARTPKGDEHKWGTGAFKLIED